MAFIFDVAVAGPILREIATDSRHRSDEVKSVQCETCGNLYPTRDHFHSPGLCVTCHREQHPGEAGDEQQAGAELEALSWTYSHSRRMLLYVVLACAAVALPVVLLGGETVYQLLVNTVLLGAMVAVMFLGPPALLVAAIVWIMRWRNR